VRLCGGDEDCPALEPPECPGFGCTPARDVVDFEPSDAGVCWADVKDAAAQQCHGCPDGQVCLQRSEDQLVCVEPGVCEALWDLGARDVCRYADKTRYDGRPLAAPNLCPGWPACGPNCPPCYDAYRARCVGRSPNHPWGLCAVVHEGVGHGQEDVPACALAPDGSVLIGCAQSGLGDAFCTVFDVPQEDVPAARRFGLCLFEGQCVAAAQLLPNWVRCYNDRGRQIAP
jgi:hypothetical protein